MVFRLDLSGSTVYSSFGYGSDSYSKEASHLVYVEEEDAAIAMLGLAG